MTTYAGVSIFHAEDGRNWAKYLRSKLGSREYAIHSELNNICDDPSNHIRSTVVNIFLISPDFLDLKDWNIMKEFNPKSSLAILTGIDFNDLKKESNRKNCKEILDWLLYELTDSGDEEQRNESVREMMLMIVAAYEGALQEDRVGPSHPMRRAFSNIDRGTRTFQTDHKPLSPVIHRPESPDYERCMSPSSPDYDTLPPKRQVNGLHTYVIKDDRLYVILHRAAEGRLRLEFSDGNVTSSDVNDQAYVVVFPHPQHDHAKAFNITLDGRTIGHSNTITDTHKTSSVVEPHYVDNYTTREHIETTSETTSAITAETEKPYQRDKPELVDACVQTDTSINEVDLHIDTNKMSDINQDIPDSNTSKLDKIYELLKEELDPEGLLCQCLGIQNDIRALDEKMKSMIECTEAFKHISYPLQCEPVEGRSSSIWPTLLHFGAQYNLMNFCDALLSNPLMHGACLTRNKDGNYPHDVALQNGHTELSILLKHFSTYVSGVGRDGLYDSGFSGGTPRLSTITLHRESRDSVPSPHHSRDGSTGYTRMSSDVLSEEISELRVKDSDKSKPRPLPRPKITQDVRTISDDVGFEEEDDQDFDTIDDENRASSSPSNCSVEESNNIFGDLLEYSPDPVGATKAPRRTSNNSVTSNESKSSFFLDEEDIEEQDRRDNRKNLKEFLGQTEGSSSDKKREKGFLRFFKKRSASESSVTGLGEKSRRYKRESNRSSSTSTSSGSSTTLHEVKGQEDQSVQYRDSDEKKSKKKFNLFMKNAKAQRRQSIRMKNVLEDKNMTGPTLPPRRRQIDETF